MNDRELEQDEAMRYLAEQEREYFAKLETDLLLMQILREEETEQEGERFFD